MRAEADTLGVQLDTVTAWLRPELLTLPESAIRTALAQEKRLREWAFYLQDVLRWETAHPCRRGGTHRLPWPAS